MELDVSLDTATGHASGKRQYKPLTITKEWGAAPPQILEAAATSEVLATVSRCRQSGGNLSDYHTDEHDHLEGSTLRRFHGVGGKSWAALCKGRFAADSLLEEDGFEIPVPP